jgi:hypothetical protein
MELMQANHQWSTRPDDQRHVSLLELRDNVSFIRQCSSEVVVPSRRLHLLPTADNKGLEVVGPNGNPYNPTHWSFGQLAQLAEAPAGYMRTLPSPIAADCLNYGLQFKRDNEDVGVLLQKNGESILRAATGPRYGRIWNSEIANALIERFGDGVSGDWRVPGEFGKAVTVTKANTTIYSSDRDMWAFLADENNRIEVPNGRDGGTEELSRGFFVWNSEVGAATFGLATFLFRYVCRNRIIWGAQQFNEIRIRHTVSAPDKFLDEVRPALESYAHGSTGSIVKAIAAAKEARLGDDLDSFLAGRFGKRSVASMKAIHELEEGRPIETLWDVTQAVTAQARSIGYQDERVALERKAGEIMDMAT